MFIPIRQRLGFGQLVVAGVAGVLIQLYAWQPIIKEKLEKEKLEKEKKLEESTTEPKA